MPSNAPNDLYTAYRAFELDEVNPLYSQLLKSVSEGAQLNSEEIINECEDFLIAMYLSGLLSTEQMSGKTVKRPSQDELMNTVYEKIDGETFADRIIKSCGMEFPNSAEWLERIFVTDGHRCFVNGQIYGARQTGGIKVWDATMDNKTRPTHADLHNTALKLDEYFETPNGKALAPAMFGVAEEDVNCRCILKIIV